MDSDARRMLAELASASRRAGSAEAAMVAIDLDAAAAERLLGAPVTPTMRKQALGLLTIIRRRCGRVLALSAEETRAGSEARADLAEIQAARDLADADLPMLVS